MNVPNGTSRERCKRGVPDGQTSLVVPSLVDVVVLVVAALKDKVLLEDDDDKDGEPVTEAIHKRRQGRCKGVGTDDGDGLQDQKEEEKKKRTNA